MSEFRKIVVIGISGTGKTVLARKISDASKLPLFHMDSFIWGENWSEIGPDQIESALAKVLSTEGWVVEGWIDRYSKDLLTKADLVLYLDFPGWVAALGGLQRWWKFRGKKRPEMPSGCVEGFGLKFLLVMLRRSERPHIEMVLADFKPRNLIRVSSRSEAERKIRQHFKKSSSSIEHS